ncbi:MAG: recombinase family protein [Rhodocyclaceae bacterium]|nr:recombinase family protein [Rhodocyclaceae bacterium]
MSNRAALYLRSSKDRTDVSIDVQRRQLSDLASAKGYIVVAEFSDAVESGKDVDRPGFQSLIRQVETRDRGWEILLALDTSRVSRRVFISAAFENDCEKNGINVVYKNLPEMEPAELILFKTIMQAMDQYHSLKSRAKGLAGMAENVRQGWRAGGRAPRGYKLEYSGTGAIREGVPVLKSKLVLGEDAEQVRAYLQKRAAGLSRGIVCTQLAIDWPVSGLNDLEWNALTYAGHTAWNVRPDTAQGKRRPRREWLVTRNTHPALISDAEADSIITALERQQQARTRQTDRPYLLTGLLRSPDGKVWSGEWDKKADAACYRLGKGRRIAAKRVDGPVLDAIRGELGSDATIDRVLDALLAISSEPTDPNAIAADEKRLSALNQKIGRLIDLMADAEPTSIDAFRRSIAQAESERGDLVRSLHVRRQSKLQADSAKNFTRTDVRTLLNRLFEDIDQSAGIGDLKRAIGDLVEMVELNPDSEACRLHFRLHAPDTGFIVASPRGFEPRLPP